jgi:hypothetical protein
MNIKYRHLAFLAFNSFLFAGDVLDVALEGGGGLG